MQQHQRGAPFLGVVGDQFIDLSYHIRRHREIRLFAQRVRNWLQGVDLAHRSHSPMTKSNEPRIATTSLSMCFGNNQERMLKFTNEGERIFSRCGVPPPLLLM